MPAQPPLADPRTDFPRWYQDVLAKADLAENGPVRGTMVIRPYGYALWERIQAELDARIKRAGAENVYLPLLIPESFLAREADHVEGFSPELAVVTHAGGKQLGEPVIVRPTSETLFGDVMARWIHSYRDLPLLLNQWANVVRWELRPRIFLRTTEFLWQEGHTAHATAADAAEYARRISLDVYRDFLVNVMAIPVFVGVKTATERFAGAVNSMTCEGIMRDGKALQLATSHELGQNFARVFDITYADASGAAQHAWTTSWGSSSRIVGGLIMAHGDARGLCVPPNIAPIQAVVIAVRDEGEVVEAARRLTRELSAAGVRARVDADVGTGLGRRITDWELKGVPARLELGPRDLIEGTVTVVRRDTGAKAAAPLDGAVADVAALLRQVQDGLLAQATRRRDAATVVAASAQEAAAAGQSGVARIGWERLGEHGEQRLLARGVSVRCLLRADGTIPDGDDPAGLDAIVARAY